MPPLFQQQQQPAPGLMQTPAAQQPGGMPLFSTPSESSIDDLLLAEIIRRGQESLQQEMMLAQAGPVTTDAGLGAPLPPMPMQKPVMGGAVAPPAQYGPPSPFVPMPIGDQGETYSATLPGPGRPPAQWGNSLAQDLGNLAGAAGRFDENYIGINKMVRDVASDPLGAALAPLDFIGAGAGSHAMGTAMRSTANAPLRGRAMRDVFQNTPWGKQQEFGYMSREAGRDARRAAQRFNRDPDVRASRAPHWTAQGKDAKGRFKELTPEARAARQRGIEKRAREQQAIERARDYNKFAN